MFFKYPFFSSHLACVFVYLHITSALLSDITFHGCMRMMSPTLIQTLFLNFPGILTILSLLSSHWTRSLSDPSINSTKPNISPSFGILILAISSSMVSSLFFPFFLYLFLNTRSSPNYTVNVEDLKFNLNSYYYEGLGFEVRT